MVAADIEAMKTVAIKAKTLAKHICDGSASTFASFREFGGKHVSTSKACLCTWHWTNHLVDGFDSLQCRIAARGAFKHPDLAKAIQDGQLTKDHIKRHFEHSQRHCEGSVDKLRTLFVYYKFTYINS